MARNGSTNPPTVSPFRFTPQWIVFEIFLLNSNDVREVEER